MKDRLINAFVWLIRKDIENFVVDSVKKEKILKRITGKERILIEKEN